MWRASKRTRGVGIDVVDVLRLGRTFDRTPETLDRVFTAKELAYCKSKHEPIPSLAGTWAAKEATVKALRLDSLLTWAKRVEITHEDGAPLLRIDGKIRTDLAISISHDGDMAIAIVIAA